MNDHLREHCLESECVFKGKLLNVYRDRVALPDGSESTREFIKHPGAVLIVPLLDDGRVIMERQYRYPPDEVFIEFPAGKIDANEAPLLTGQRELREETGYTAKQWHYLGAIRNAIGYSNERILIYVAQGLVPGPTQLDEGELLEVYQAPLSEVIDGTRNGQVTDVKTIIAAYWAAEWLRGERQALPSPV